MGTIRAPKAKKSKAKAKASATKAVATRRQTINAKTPKADKYRMTTGKGTGNNSFTGGFGG